MSLSSEQTQRLVQRWLAAQPAEHACVVCGITVKSSWHVERIGPNQIQIWTVTNLDYWADYSGHTERPGWHCPSCYRNRIKREQAQ